MKRRQLLALICVSLVACLVVVFGLRMLLNSAAAVAEQETSSLPPPRPQRKPVVIEVEQREDPTSETAKATTAATETMLTAAPPSTAASALTSAPPTTTQTPPHYELEHRPQTPLECARSPQHGGNSYWNFTANRCLLLPGWGKQRSDFPATCHKYSHKQRSIVITHATTAASSHESFGPFRSFVDAQQLEDLYVITNFCVDTAVPAPSLFASSVAAVEPFEGAEETRNAFMTLASFKRFLEGVTVVEHLFSGQLLVTQAPKQMTAILFPLSPATRNNIGHTMLRVLSTIGILRLLRSNKWHGEGFSSSSSGFALILVDLPAAHGNETDNDKGAAVRRQSRQRQHSAIDFFLGVLDVDIVITTRVVNDNKEREQELKKHNKQQKQQQPHFICFHRGVAWQNCRSGKCSGRDESRETVSYSFGIWTKIIGHEGRTQSLRSFREGLLCPARISSSSAVASANGNEAPVLLLPRLVFDIRSRWRRLFDFALFADKLSSDLEGFVQTPIIFSEPDVELGAAYASDADIFAGAHGSGFSFVTLMKPGSSIVEVSSRFFSCAAYYSASTTANNHSAGDDARCWFGRIADALDIEHRLVILPDNALTWQRGRIPPSIFVDEIKQSACRWLLRKSSIAAGGSARWRLPSECLLMAKRLKHEGAAAAQQLLVTTEMSAQEYDSHQRRMIVDLVGALSAGGGNSNSNQRITISEDEASAILDQLKWLRDDVNERNAKHVFLEGCPSTEFWQVIVDHVISHEGFGVVRVHQFQGRKRRHMRKQSSSVKLAELPQPKNNNQGNNVAEAAAVAGEDGTASSSCCWCLYGDRARFYARQQQLR